MPKKSKRKVGVTDPGVDPSAVGDARIRVGATRAPTITPVQGKEQGALGSLFDALGEFADGPFARAMRDQHFQNQELRAETAVMEGTTLDEVEDPNFVFEHYYKGAMGRKQGTDMVTKLVEGIEANKDDETFDVDRFVEENLKAGFSQMDDTTATNAVGIVKRYLPGMMQKEKIRRTNAARLAVYNTKLESADRELQLAIKAGDPEQMNAVFDATWADSKLLPGFDKKAHNEWEVAQYMAALREHGPTAALLASMQRKRPNGSSLWNHPDYGTKLREAVAKAEKAQSTKRSVAQRLTVKQLKDAAKDYDQMHAVRNEDLAAHYEAGTITEAEFADIVWDRDATIKYHEETLPARVQALVDGDLVPSDAEWVSDSKEINATAWAMNDWLTRVGSDDEKANRLAIVEQFASNGMIVPDFKVQMNAAFGAGKYDEVLEYKDRIAGVSPQLSAEQFEPNERAALEFYRTMAASAGAETAKQLVRDALPNLTDARHSLRERANRNIIAPILDGGKLNARDRAHVEDMTAMYVAAGYQPRTAATEALRIFDGETTTDSNGTRMTPNNYIKGWERPEVEEIVRKEFLRPYLAKRNIDPNGGLWSDVDDRAIIEPQSNGTGLLMVGNTIIGVLPLDTWVGLAAQRADRVASEGIAQGKAEADAKRFGNQSKGARGLSELSNNPNALP